MMSARMEAIMVLELSPGVVVDPEVRFGKPVIKGTRVPVELVIGKLAGGMTADEIAEEYGITQGDVLAALGYAARILASEVVLGVA
jgi:uncharacterized protein (DUF433 family)